MSSDATAECVVCRKHRGEVTAPGGLVFANDLISVYHAQLWGEEKDHYLGHFFVESNRHVPQLADLNEQEAQAIGVWASRVAQALLQTEGMEHVYAFYIGDGVPHVHVHVIGRRPGAPREYWGSKVDEWPGAPRGGEAEIAQVADRVRVYLREHYSSLTGNIE